MIPVNELPECPVATTLKVMGGKWKMLVVQQLLAKTMRYSELKEAIPDISEKSLVETLKQMEADGVVTRIEYPELPRRVEYSLSELGETMRPVIGAMADWGGRYQAAARMAEGR